MKRFIILILAIIAFQMAEAQKRDSVPRIKGHSYQFKSTGQYNFGQIVKSKVTITAKDSIVTVSIDKGKTFTYKAFNIVRTDVSIIYQVTAKHWFTFNLEKADSKKVAMVTEVYPFEDYTKEIIYGKQ